MQAACSSDAAVAKTAVETLRRVISHVLQEQAEPRHFHFNEALFKPYENLLCLEMCDTHLHDQVIHFISFNFTFPKGFATHD